MDFEADITVWTPPREHRPVKGDGERKNRAKKDEEAGYVEGKQFDPANISIHTVIDRIIKEWPLCKLGKSANICTAPSAFKTVFEEALDRTERYNSNAGFPLQSVATVRNMLETLVRRTSCSFH